MFKCDVKQIKTMVKAVNNNESTPLKMGGRIVIDLSHGAYTSVATALKEYISNSWDAGSNVITVRVFNPETPESTIIEIIDDGCGMTRKELEDKFFRIGRDRRREEGPVIKTIRGNRTIHGRKGLGKLAGLKMANLLQVVSWTKTSLNGAYISLKEIENNPNTDPLVHWKQSLKPAGAGECGTLIRLEDYSRSEPIDMEELHKLLSHWFEFGSEAKVTLEHRKGVEGSSTIVGQWHIARSNIFHNLKTKNQVLDICWEQNGKSYSQKVQVKWGTLTTSDTSVRSLISVFSGTRALSTQEDFNVKKGWTNMFGIYKLVAEFRADWLDQTEGLDPADIKREGINWDLHPALQSFREVGAQWVKDTCAGMAKSPSGKSEIKDNTERLVKKNKRFNKWPENRRAKLIEIVTNYASREGISTDELTRLIDLFAFVLENGALIQFLQSLKESGKKDIDGFMEFALDFTATEITGLLQVTKNKLELVNELARLIADPKTLEVQRAGRENITTFLAKSPWIFDPELRIDHSNVTIKRIVLETEGFDNATINKLPREYFNIRPDFVGYLGPSNNAICIELKKPDKEMSKEEAQRVIAYRAVLLDPFPKLKVIAVSGSFSNEAKKLLKSIDGIEMVHYATLLERGQNQLSDFIKKLENGLASLDSKNVSKN